MLRIKACKLLAFLLLCGGSIRAPVVADESEPPYWVAGDCTFDGRANLIDALYLLQHLFGEPKPFLCQPLCDLDGDQNLSMGDVTWLLAGLFRDTELSPQWAPAEFCDEIDNDCDGLLNEGCLDGDGVSFTLCWDPVSTDAEGNPLYISGYRVHLGTESKVYPVSADLGQTTCVRMIQLLPDVTYYIAVTAYDIAGVEGEVSGEISTRDGQ